MAFAHVSLFGFGTRGLLEKVSFQKSPLSRDSREFRDSRDSREPPDNGKQRRLRPFSRDSKEFRDSRDSKDSSSEKTSFVMTFFRSRSVFPSHLWTVLCVLGPSFREPEVCVCLPLRAFACVCKHPLLSPLLRDPEYCRAAEGQRR